MWSSTSDMGHVSYGTDVKNLRVVLKLHPSFNFTYSASASEYEQERAQVIQELQVVDFSVIGQETVVAHIREWDRETFTNFYPPVPISSPSLVFYG